MSNTSFLPEDYLAQKAERRTNLICLTLFGVVMTVVFALFLFTNKQRSRILADQEQINLRYQKAAMQIEELTKLEEQKEKMLEKAELAAALVERVPRSILLAELINRMPPRLGLISLEMESRPIKSAKKNDDKPEKVGRPRRAKTKQQAEQEVTKVEAPRYLVTLSMIGLAPTDLEVSRYMAELNAYELLRDVRLEYSEETEVDERIMREFRIHMRLDPSADVRHVDPLIMSRGIRNPMTDKMEFTAPGSKTAVLVNPEQDDDEDRTP